MYLLFLRCSFAAAFTYIVWGWNKWWENRFLMTLIVSHTYSVMAVFTWLVTSALICYTFVKGTCCATDACVFTFRMRTVKALRWENVLKLNSGDKEVYVLENNEVSRYDFPARVFTCVLSIFWISHADSCFKKSVKTIQRQIYPLLWASAARSSWFKYDCWFSFYRFYLQFRFCVQVEELNQMREN